MAPWSRIAVRLPLAVAWALFALGFLVPVGLVAVESLQVQEVVRADGSTLRAAGDVKEARGRVLFATQSGPGAPKEQQNLRRAPAQGAAVDPSDVVEVRTVFSLAHHAHVLGDERTAGLLRNSLYIAGGGALLAVLLGACLAFVLARVQLPGRGLLAVLLSMPMVLPPFFVALGGARTWQGWIQAATGAEGAALQMLNSVAVFGLTLYPVAMLLLWPMLIRLPAGPYDAAWLLRGKLGALRTVVLPAVLPPLAAAFLLVFVLAMTDFAVPDVTGFMLPLGGAPGHVYATEVFFQVQQEGSRGRAVATALPLLLATSLLLVVAWGFLRRTPLLEHASRRREPRPLSLTGRLLAWGPILAVLWIALLQPLQGIAGWASDGGESQSAGSAPGARLTGPQARALFDFEATLDATPDSRELRDRWLKTGAAAALLALLIAVPILRAARRGGRVARGAAVLAALLPMAVPGVVLSVGTLLLWRRVPASWVDESILRSVLALATRFLPLLLVAGWLALRRVGQGQEQAAALLGAGPARRALTIWGPLSAPGWLAGALFVLVFALRELDTVVLIDNRILPMTLYSKIHFNRMADEANLLFLCLAYLFIPAVAALLLCALTGGGTGVWRRGRRRP